MKYISLFSGIGGFEIAINNTYPDAICLGYSEVKPIAIKVYEEHFPDHHNIGDITTIATETIQELVNDGCDLIVGGFPCTNLSSMAGLKGDNSGLQGPKSGLFYDLLRVIKIVSDINPDVNFIVENNASMSVSNRVTITDQLSRVTNKKVYMTKIDNASVSVQTRKRLFWTTFPVNQPEKCLHTWDDILEPLNDIEDRYIVSDTYMNGMNTVVSRKHSPAFLVFMRRVGEYQDFISIENDEKLGSTRYQMSMHSDTGDITPYAYPHGKSRPICAGGGGGFSQGMLIDRRAGGDGCFVFRYFTMKEKERLFGFIDNYTASLCNSARSNVLGNSVSIYCVEHILNYM